LKDQLYLTFGDIITYVADIFKEKGMLFKFRRKQYNNQGMFCEQHEKIVKRKKQFEETHIFIC
jgi:hypothetical protein